MRPIYVKPCMDLQGALTHSAATARNTGANPLLLALLIYHPKHQWMILTGQTVEGLIIKMRLLHTGGRREDPWRR